MSRKAGWKTGGFRRRARSLSAAAVACVKPSRAAALAAACGMSPELRLSGARSTARAGGGLQSDRHGRIEVVDRSCAHGGNRSNCPWTAPKPNAVALAAGQAAEPLPRKAGWKTGGFRAAATGGARPASIEVVERSCTCGQFGIRRTGCGGQDCRAPGRLPA